MNAVVIIPARMASSRFPGKPLADICGKPMVQWVYERASQATGISGVIVATCDREIADAVRRFGGEAVMTSDKHRSGTDRLAEAAAELEAEIIINVQGDEPLIDPVSIEKALAPLERGSEVMASLMVPITREEARNANLVKVVVSLDGHALYFSRSPIPYCRDEQARARVSETDRHGQTEHKKSRAEGIFGHVGLYACTRDFLLRFASWEPTPLEKTEALEQLRVLEHGYRIKMVEIAQRPMAVDTPEDLERVRDAVRGILSDASNCATPRCCDRRVFGD
ncbi:MAG: 3-deoxy-manno-octulosonate cytidylyltransferase [Armatimonadota bacterium]